MRLNIELDKSSVNRTIKQINKLKKKISNDLHKLYLRKCVEWIKEQANSNLNSSAIGSETKALIQSSWAISYLSENAIRLSNTAKYEDGKNIAVFVEFGVGVVGEQSKHTLAEEANYEYNVPSTAKTKRGYWAKTLDGGENSMNIESGYYYAKESESGFTFLTKGSPATMFLYKAWKSFETLGVYKTLWEEAKAEIIG